MDKKWVTYKDQEEIILDSVADFPTGCIGFIYGFYFDSGQFYIGKKNLYSIRKKPLGKKALAALDDKRKSKYALVLKETDWKTYKSSNKDVKALIDSGAKYDRIVIEFAFSKKELTYLELKWQILEECLFRSNCFNDNIMGKFFKNEFRRN